jgi:hypothetical protein
VSIERDRRAAALIASRKITMLQRDEAVVRAEVDGRGGRYLVERDPEGWWRCTCANGGRTCSHRVAVEWTVAIPVPPSPFSDEAHVAHACSLQTGEWDAYRTEVLAKIDADATAVFVAIARHEQPTVDEARVDALLADVATFLAALGPEIEELRRLAAALRMEMSR